MGRIHHLSAELSNQIAAGEVVERPASVVKELIENAMDANATRIRVEIDHGGIARILVSDDGDGMDKVDAPLALERHATSKIQRIEDLTHIASFGFRGEALPSIASVSRLSLLTRRADASEGTEVVVGDGGSGIQKPAASAKGTTVEVRDLFCNVPARRKFLKATATESAHVGEVVLFAALSRPEITFQLFRDGRLSREYLKSASRKDRAEDVLQGARLVQALSHSGEFRVEAFLAPPERARVGAGGLHILVNGRPVKDRQLSRAVAQAYGSVLAPGHFPVGAVYIDLPHEHVDVNVHPQKAEVRFREARALFDVVTRDLHASLAKAFESVAAISPRDLHRPRWNPTPYFQGSTQRTHLPEPSLFQGRSTTDPDVDRGEEFSGVAFYSKLRFLSQLRRMFLLCEGEDGLYVLDQHAAAERLNFDRLRASYRAQRVPSQKLLTPTVVELSADEADAIASHEANLEELGLDLRRVGPTSVAVVATPALVGARDPEMLLRALAAEWTKNAGRAFSEQIDHILATMACHGSVRAGDAVSAEQAHALLQALDSVDFVGYCPHGRPVVTRIGYDELEKRVGR